MYINPVSLSSQICVEYPSETVAIGKRSRELRLSNGTGCRENLTNKHLSHVGSCRYPLCVSGSDMPDPLSSIRPTRGADATNTSDINGHVPSAIYMVRHGKWTNLTRHQLTERCSSLYLARAFNTSGVAMFTRPFPLTPISLSAERPPRG